MKSKNKSWVDLEMEKLRTKWKQDAIKWHFWAQEGSLLDQIWKGKFSVKETKSNDK